MAATRLNTLAAALAAALVVTLAAAPADGFAQVQAYGDAARVNGAPIKVERLERNFDEFLREKRLNLVSMRSPNRAAKMKRELLDLLIDHELLWQEAQKRRLEAPAAEVDAAVASVRGSFKSPETFVTRLATDGYTPESYHAHVKRILSARRVVEHEADSVKVTDRQVDDYMKKNAADFVNPEQRKMRHIYVPFGASTDEAAKAAARTRVRAIADEAQRGGDFAALAREHSQGMSASKGGEIGFVQRHELAKPLADAAFKVPNGGVTDLIELPDGLHLLKVEEVTAAERMPDAVARERVRAVLQAQGAEQARTALLRRLRAAAKIEVLLPLPPASEGQPDEKSPQQRARAAMEGGPSNDK
ncbi:MAG TPA: peptidylprolyl isomerase [Albitalea sp.]